MAPASIKRIAYWLMEPVLLEDNPSLIAPVFSKSWRVVTSDVCFNNVEKKQSVFLGVVFSLHYLCKLK